MEIDAVRLLGEVGKLAEIERSPGLGRANPARRLSTRVKGGGPLVPRAAANEGPSLPPHLVQREVAPPPNTTTDTPAKGQPTTSGRVSAPRTNRENAFTHPATSKRVSHLTKKEPVVGAEELAFIYDVSDKSQNAIKLEAGHADHGDGKAGEESKGSMQPNDFNLVTTVQADVGAGVKAHTNVEQSEDSGQAQEGKNPSGQYPSLRPTTRKEVALLKHTMIALLQDIGCDLDQDYPTEMHAFLAIIQEEQKIYDAVFQEIIRQVTVNMIERGEVLAEIRRRYGSMFSKIPRHVRHLHTELVAQRKLNRRLTEELMRSKEVVADLWSELDAVRKHDVEVTKQAQDAQEKLVSVLTQSDNTDEILEEYHKLYRMQRDRLEEAVRSIELEKRVWVEAATGLAMRIGMEHGMTDLVLLQKHENSRLRATNHMIVIISNINDGEMTNIEKKIDEWRTKIVKLSQAVVDEDLSNISVLTKMQRDMKMVLKNLNANEPVDTIEVEHPLLKMFHIYDVKSLAENLMRWVENVTSVAIRFTSDRDISLQEDIQLLRKTTEAWIEAGLKLLRRNEKNTNSKDYIPLTEVLTKLGAEIEEWLNKMEMRISGEDGIASHVISLQNQLEDRYTTYSARDFDKPLPSSERAALKESLSHWIEQIGVLMETLSNSSEKEQQKIPMHVENWIKRLVDQLNTDTDLRNEENLKLHTSMLSWMVHLLVKGGKEKPNESWDHDFHQLHQELISFNMNLLRDSSDLEMVGDDQKDLRTVVQLLSENWVNVARRLLQQERRNAEKLHGEESN
ncbi:Axonemal dynein light chain domain-containing protein 1 [Phlyctochytrium bullatum]|nr:Axonemal dynein light chain domain-containing protein 1 [Phlyctochytrium bullatum]